MTAGSPTIKAPDWTLETVACPNCTADSFSAAATRADGLKIVRCDRCALAFLNPRPILSDIHRLYQADYYQGGDGKTIGYSAYAHSLSEIRLYAPSGWTLLQEQIALRGARALDVGCAFGKTVYWLRRSGARALGIDLAAEAVAQGRALGLDLRVGSLESLTEPDEAFDLITMIDVIEHVAALDSFVACLRRLIKPGGVMFVQTPNFRTQRKWGDRCHHLHMSLEHLLYFESDTLDDAFRRRGLIPKCPTRAFINGPAAIDGFRAWHNVSPGLLRRAAARLPGVDWLRLARARLFPPPSPLTEDPPQMDGTTIIGCYGKPDRAG